MRAEETFFRGYRRETIIDGATILCNAAGEKRLKLSMRLPLSGDQLVGMPSWVGEPFADIAKPEYAVKSISSTKELDPMLLHVFGLPPGEKKDEKELITFGAVRMCSFKIERDSEEEHPPISLTFTAYLPRTGRYLKFADDNFNTSIFILYEAGQPSLLDENPNVQATDPGPETSKPAKPNGATTIPPHDEFEKDRAAAADPGLDPEFDLKPAKPKEKPVAVPKKGKGGKTEETKRVDGYGKPLASAVL